MEESDLFPGLRIERAHTACAIVEVPGGGQQPGAIRRPGKRARAGSGSAKAVGYVDQLFPTAAISSLEEVYAAVVGNSQDVLIFAEGQRAKLVIICWGLEEAQGLGSVAWNGKLRRGPDEGMGAIGGCQQGTVWR